MEWHYIDDVTDEQFADLLVDQLKGKISVGTFKPTSETMFWNENLDEWTSLINLPDLQKQLTLTPLKSPPRKHKRSKTATNCQNPGCNELHRSESGFCHLHRSLADGVRRVVYQGQRPPRLPWPENTQALWQISENAGTGYSSAAMESPSKKNESRHASAHRRSIFQQLTARMKNARLKAQSKKNDASLRNQEGGRLQERIDRALEGKRLHRSLKQ